MRVVYAVLCVALLCGVATLSGCTTLPTSSTPQALRSFEAFSDTASNIMTPVAGEEPDLLVRDFFTASANPTNKHASARTFLTETAARDWDDQTADIRILDRVDIHAQSALSSTNARYTVQGTVVATLGDGGVYTATNDYYDVTIDLTKVDGEWRINALPSGVVIENTDFRNSFTPYNLYFLDSKYKALVPDRRWIYKNVESVDTSLLSLLQAGPNKTLAPGVRTEFPANATFLGKRDGEYIFSGLEDLSAESRYRFAAQVAWTLGRAGVQEPYRLVVDNLELSEFPDGITLVDVAGLNPSATGTVGAPFYAFTGSTMYRADGETATVEPSPELGFGVDPIFMSADYSAATDLLATVVKDRSAPASQEGTQSRLYFRVNGIVVDTGVAGKELVRPSCENDGSAVWTVVDGRTVVRVTRSPSSGDISRVPVTVRYPEGVDGQISGLRLSYSGVYAALIIDGTLYVGVVQRTDTGEYSIVNIKPLTPGFDVTVLSVDWQPDGSLVLGTTLDEAPVWRVDSDGSTLSALASGNVVAPVVSVAVSSTTVYVTDTRSILHLDIEDTRSTFWREVPGLQGLRVIAAPSR